MPRLKRAEKASLSLLQWEDTIQRYHQLGARNWVLTGLCVCLSLGLPSFQNSEIEISVVQESPGLGIFSQQPGQMEAPTCSALVVVIVVICFISAYFSSRKTLLLLFQAVNIYYALPSVYLFLFYIPSVLPCFHLVLFSFLLPTELPFALLLNKWLLPTHSHHICPPRSWFQSSCHNSWTFFF